jgi:hypothetical protein
VAFLLKILTFSKCFDCFLDIAHIVMIPTAPTMEHKQQGNGKTVGGE